MKNKLNDRQELFCKEYLISLNATDAARKAGYSEKTANEQAARMLTNTNIQEYLQTLQKARSERLEITADRVMLEVARLAFSDIRKLFNTDGTIKKIHELDDDTAAILSSIETEYRTEGNGEAATSIITKKVKLWDKSKNLEALMKHLGMYEKDNRQKTFEEQQLTPEQQILFEEIKKRAGEEFDKRYGLNGS